QFPGFLSLAQELVFLFLVFAIEIAALQGVAVCQILQLNALALLDDVPVTLAFFLLLALELVALALLFLGLRGGAQRVRRVLGRVHYGLPAGGLFVLAPDE